MTLQQLKITWIVSDIIGPVLLHNKLLEKAVKSIYILQGESVERVHSIAILIKGDPQKKINGIQELISNIEDAQELDRHYIPTRYPNGVPFGKPYEFYSKTTAEGCIKCAQKLILNCRKTLGAT